MIFKIHYIRSSPTRVKSWAGQPVCSIMLSNFLRTGDLASFISIQNEGLPKDERVGVLVHHTLAAFLAHGDLSTFLSERGETPYAPPPPDPERNTATLSKTTEQSTQTVGGLDSIVREASTSPVVTTVFPTLLPQVNNGSQSMLPPPSRSPPPLSMSSRL